MERQELESILQKLDQKLKSPTTLHIQGGCACILLGEEQRSTFDIDLVASKSRYEETELQQAGKEAGLLLEPSTFEDLESEKPFLQILPEGALYLPQREGRTLWKGKTLEITGPLPQDLVLSKLRRYDSIDAQDIAFLIINYQLRPNDLEEAFHLLPEQPKKDPRLQAHFRAAIKTFFDKEPNLKPPKQTKKKEKLYHPIQLEWAQFGGILPKFA